MFNRIHLGYPCIVDPYNKMQQSRTGVEFATPITKLNNGIYACVANITPPVGDPTNQFIYVHKSLLYPIKFIPNGDIQRSIVYRYPENMPLFSQKDLMALSEIVANTNLKNLYSAETIKRIRMLNDKLQWYSDTTNDIMEARKNEDTSV